MKLIQMIKINKNVKTLFKKLVHARKFKKNLFKNKLSIKMNKIKSKQIFLIKKS